MEHTILASSDEIQLISTQVNLLKTKNKKRDIEKHHRSWASTLTESIQILQTQSQGKITNMKNKYTSMLCVFSQNYVIQASVSSICWLVSVNCKYRIGCYELVPISLERLN